MITKLNNVFNLINKKTFDSNVLDSVKNYLSFYDVIIYEKIMKDKRFKLICESCPNIPLN